jgi:predicted DNA-binding protein with PD1-like motif
VQTFEISNNRYLLKLERGEEAMDLLRRFADAREIGAGVLRGIGAALSAELAYYNMPQKHYETIPVQEVTEVIGFLGNVGRGEDGRPIVHVHATLSRRDGSAVGGHVMSLVVGATLEVDLEIVPGTLHRKLDPAFDLPLQHAYETPPEE